MGGDEPDVDIVDPAVAVHITLGDIAVVGHGDGVVGDVGSHQQGVHDVDPAVVVHVAQQPAGRGLFSRDGARLLDHQVQGTLAGVHSEGRIHIGDQARTGDGQAIDGSARRLGLQARGCRTLEDTAGGRHPGLSVNQHHSLGGNPPTALHPVEIETGPNGPPRGIGAVPACAVIAGGLLPIHERGDSLAKEVEDLQAHVGDCRQLIGDDGGGVEGVGVVLAQGESFRQGRRCMQSRQGKGKDPSSSVVAAATCRKSAKSNSITWTPGAGAPDDKLT